METKGFRLNVGATLSSTGTYDWATNESPIIDTELEETFPVADQIVLSRLDGSQSLTMSDEGIIFDISEASTSITLTAGGTSITIEKDGNIIITSSGSNTIQLNGNNNIVVADSDNIQIDGQILSLQSMNLTGVVGTAPPYPLAPVLTASAGTIGKINASGTLTLTASTRKVKTS